MPWDKLDEEQMRSAEEPDPRGDMAFPAHAAADQHLEVPDAMQPPGRDTPADARQRHQGAQPGKADLAAVSVTGEVELDRP